MQKEIRKIIDRKYPFALLELQYKEDDFPQYFLTSEIFSYHRGKHHAGYINKLNGILSLEENADLRLINIEKLIEHSRKIKNPAIFNNAAQIWNHDFFWLCLSPTQRNKNENKLLNKILEEYNSWEHFVEIFTNASLGLFGSGWSWLVLAKGRLQVITTSNAELPLNTLESVFPIFTCDLWEHSYYIAFKNDRAKYVQTMLNEFLDWEMLNANYDAAILNTIS
jgi:Fe-Mn family superoxide dismutase